MSQLDWLHPPKNFNGSAAGIDLSEVEPKLPELLRKVLSMHDEANEYLTLLMSILIITGGLIPEVWATYDRRRTFPMLMLFITCPPAGGKGIVNLAAKLLSRINRYLSELHNSEMECYKRELEIQRKASKSGSLSPIPVEPKRKQLLVAGNITSAKLIEQLDNNKPMALVMIETEADLIATTLKSDHGQQISSLFRQAFHHERISVSRKTNDEWREIETPKMAMVLTGTESQLLSMFPSNQDGLYSRFMFIRDATSMAWRSVKPNVGSKPLDDHYTHWAECYFKIWQQTLSYKAEVTFPDWQWDLLDQRGKDNQAVASHTAGEYAVSIARRHALMVIRLASILSFLRRVNPDTVKVDTSINSWACSDVDFGLAMTLTDVSFRNSLEIFQAMPQQTRVTLASQKRMSFFDCLTDSFNMESANKQANLLNIPDRTKTRWLKEFCEIGILEHTNRGEYRKTAMAAMALMAVNQSN